MRLSADHASDGCMLRKLDEDGLDAATDVLADFWSRSDKPTLRRSLEFAISAYLHARSGRGGHQAAGGFARAEKLSAEERKAIAKKAAKVRWGKKA